MGWLKYFVLIVTLVACCNSTSAEFVRVKSEGEKGASTRNGKKLPIFLPVPIFINANKGLIPKLELPVKEGSSLPLKGEQLYKDDVRRIGDKLRPLVPGTLIPGTSGPLTARPPYLGLYQPSFPLVGSALRGLHSGLSGVAATFGGKVGAIAGSVAGSVAGALHGASSGAHLGAAKGVALVSSGKRVLLPASTNQGNYKNYLYKK